MNLPLGARLWIADAPKDPKGMILICPGGGYQIDLAAHTYRRIGIQA